MILGFRTMRAQALELFGALRIVCDDHSSVTRSTEVLRRKEREASIVADRAGSFAAAFGADGLRGILDDHQPVLPRYAHDRFHVRHLPVKVYGDRKSTRLNSSHRCIS